MPGILVCRHDYESRVIEPSCAERGYTLYTCKDCGNSYEGDFVEKLEHTEAEDWIIDKEPTEEAAGSRHKECTVCGSTLKNEIIKKLGSSTKAEDTYVMLFEDRTEQIKGKGKHMAFTFVATTQALKIMKYYNSFATKVVDVSR